MLSHKSTDISEETIQAAVQEIRSDVEGKTLSDTEKKERLILVTMLTEFALGRFLLVNRGLNGYWTDVILNRPLDPNANRQYVNSLEEYLMERSPPFVARCEAQRVIHREVRPLLRPGRAVASVPSGLMSEILLATQKPFAGVDLFAIDLDADNFAMIRERYGDRLKGNTLHTLHMDARQLEMSERFDLICSSGLTIYMPNDDDVQALLHLFFTALKPNGKLVTTFGATSEEYSPLLAALPRTYTLLSVLAYRNYCLLYILFNTL